MKKTIPFLVGILGLLIHFEAAGKHNFSPDKATFFEELHEFLLTKSNKDAMSLVLSIETKTNSGEIDQENFKGMVEICNQMKTLKMKPKPCFWNYLSAVDISQKEKLKPWHEQVDKILANTKQGKFKRFNKFLEFSYHYNKSDYLRFSKSGICWQADAANQILSIEENVPIIKFERANLIAKRKDNQIQIINAAGTFYPLANKWIGKGGKVSWKRLDGSSEISCNLLDYEIDFSKNTYTATKAFLIYPKYFENKLIEGVFQDKLRLGKSSKEESFPRFTSKDQDLTLDNLAPGIKFKGGVQLEGLTLKVSNTDEKKANLIYVSKDGEFKSKLSAKSFLIHDSGKIHSKQASTTLFFGKDSIYHPGAYLKFIPGEKMELYAGEKSASKAPYFDSHLNTFFYADRVLVDLSTSKMHINPRGGRIANFQSKEFYDANYMYRIQNVSDRNPIIILHIMALDYGKKIEAPLYAKRINPKFTVTNIKNLLFDLERHGFLTYNVDNQFITLSDKVALYTESHGKKRDYDIMNIESNSDSTSAVYDLKAKTIAISGVEKLQLQNRQKVDIEPDNKFLKLGQNRDFNFSGKINAGITNLIGKDFYFDYENFQVKMDSVDKFNLSFPADETYEYEDQQFTPLNSTIENTSGFIQVNQADNKSGTTKIAQYPSLSTNAPAYVYYNTKNAQGKVYKRDSFYFELDPFEIQSLDSLTTESFDFDGKIFSAGIFPPFKEKLVLQKEDMSLGFDNTTPANGISMYRKTGNFNGKIHLSNKGLLGDGEISYANTKVKSEDLILKPKVATGSAEKYHLKEDKSKSIPEVRGENVMIVWKPYNDSMIVTSRDKSFELFNQGNHKIGGTLVSTSQGLKGKGIFQWGEGEMKSKLFDFGAFAVESEKTDLKINSFESDKLAFETKNLNGKMDFEAQKGRFKSNEKSQTTKMPANHIVTSLNEFEWDLGKKALTFIAEKGKMGQFISTHPDQDSLNFEGKTANFDFQSGLLTIGGVEKIEVADAYITPSKNIIKVETGGYIQHLENAMIVANRTNNYHTFTDASLSIFGKYSYEGKGTYEYKIGGMTQYIEFPNIQGKKRGKGKYSEKESVTTASISLTQNDKFYLDPKTYFYGDINLIATNPYLDFDGYAKMDAPILAKPNWFSVQFSGDKNNMLIASNKPENPEGVVLYTGIYLNKTSSSSYANTLMPLNEKEDRTLFDANGVFKYDYVNHRYIFGPKSGFDGDLAKGNKLFFNQKTGDIRALGQFNICPNVRGLKVELIGDASTGLAAQNLSDPSKSKEGVTGNFVTKLDLLLPKKLMKIIEDDFVSSKDSTENVTFSDKELYRTAINLWSENAKFKHLSLSELNIKDNFYIKEKKNTSSLVLADMNMKWSNVREAFITTGEELVLNSINGKEYNRKIKAIAAFMMPSNEDDRIYMILRTNSKNYYYLNYKKGILHVQSNNALFNDTVEGMKEKALTTKLPDGKTYVIQLTTPEAVANFRRGIKEW